MIWREFCLKIFYNIAMQYSKKSKFQLPFLLTFLKILIKYSTIMKYIFYYFQRPEKKECGDNGDSSRIVGGATTKPGTYPSAALLGRMELVNEKDPFNPLSVKKVSKLKFTCGGTLINGYVKICFILEKI